MSFPKAKSAGNPSGNKERFSPRRVARGDRTSRNDNLRRIYVVLYNSLRLSSPHPRRQGGFTLLEVMISLAVIGGLLVTLIYTLNYHLGIADRHGVTTLSMVLAKEKLYEMEKNPSASKGSFPEPFSTFSYETSVKASSFPEITEIAVVVRNGKEDIAISELIRKSLFSDSKAQSAK